MADVNFKELSTQVRTLERQAKEEVQVRVSADKGRKFKYRMALGEDAPSFKALVAEVKKLEKIIAASKFRGITK